jgi:hypothetical protein
MVRRWVLVHCSQWHLTPNLTMRSFVDIRVIQEKHSTRTLSLLWLKKNLQTSTLAFKGGRVKLRKPSILVINWVSSCLSFFLSAFTAATYIFTAPNCTTTIISLELCALNGEYQHFILSCSIPSILRFIKMSLLCGYHWKRGDRGVKGGPKTGWRQHIANANYPVFGGHLLRP